MKIIKKVSLLIPSLFLTPTLIACSAQHSEQKIKNDDNGIKLKETNYDLGLTAAPLSSLNYVLYSSTDTVVPSLVDPILKQGPNQDLKSLFPTRPVTFGVYSTGNNQGIDEYINSGKIEGENSLSNSFYSFSDFNYASGTLTSNPVSAQNLRGLRLANDRYATWSATLNDGSSRWSNGDSITADDYIDYIHYIGDNNSGSQKQILIDRRDIKGFKEFITAQNDYLKKHQKAYTNPWGYPKFKKDENGQYIYDIELKDPNTNEDLSNEFLWASENENDLEDVKKIREAALGVGLYSGRLYFNISNKDFYNMLTLKENENFRSDLDVANIFYKDNNGEIKEMKIRKNPYVDPKQKFDFSKITPKGFQEIEEARAVGKYVLLPRDEYEIRIEYESSNPKSLSEIIRDMTDTLLPVNRSFVENSVGGLKTFGNNSDKFLTAGPFKITDLVLGGQGGMTLEKNNDYYNVSKVIPNTIKIYFNDEANAESTMFKDGYISKARIPSTQQRSYWAIPEYKKLMNKGTGFGTLGFMFNLDKQTNKDSYINDKDLRNAIYYAINRTIMLFNSGWNNSYPVITWTAFGNAHKNNGTAIEFGFQNQFTNVKGDSKIKVPLQNYDYVDHLSKQYKFEATNRNDQAYLPEVAKHYLDIFKQKHPNLKKVELKYVYNSIEEQKNVGLALKNALNTLFDGYIDLDLKALPENTYNATVETGDFDIAYRNFDTFGQNIDSYIKAFFVEDGIIPNESKNIGFKDNPSGGFTYAKYFDNLNQEQDLKENKLVSLDEEQTRLRLEIEPQIWNKVKELSYKKDNETQIEYIQRYSSFFSQQFTPEEIEQGFDENKIIEIVAAFEKIIRDAAPVVPLMEVDTYWEISRVGGVSSLYKYDLQYAYDIYKPPRNDLPQQISRR
ncbi:ABC transporter substrate-binding protein [Mycoplasmopsis ciconiae]|uniref:ABC transporter substrate-binding protein n=1 Tax=Mycoplasmopsis ciconiae TaxID=561067 RepID=A0ABU7MMR5_9BACT|nr:ABC transporter substrate-binding protein [Mycoplasmopsis ciconiae]